MLLAYVSTNSEAARPSKKMSINQTNELLAIIAQLSEMKDKGILTEEEFSEKKKELLSQI